MGFRISIVGIVVGLLALPVIGWSAGTAGAQVSAPSPVSATAEDPSSEILLQTSFESEFPVRPWGVDRPPGSAEVNWGRTTYRASEGRYSIYCAGVGPAAPGDGGPAPANTASWAIVGPYDLSETTAGTLTFNLWLRTEKYQDVFMWLVSTDGETYSGSARSTNTDGWQTITTDLANWGAAGNVIGQAEVWIAFVYQSDFNNLFEGAYVDEVELVVDLGTPGSEGATYTTDADFAEGTMVGLQSTSDQLELSDHWDALPYLWVPNSGTGTVSKIDPVTGAELGRYEVGPDSLVSPSVAAVDLQGSCWVGNRVAGSVVKIGLLENGGCVDRNGNGVIDTSTDSNANGDISGNEMLAWGQDECVLIEIVLVEGNQGPHPPGEIQIDYEATELQAVAVDADGDVWVGVYETNQLYHLDGGSAEILEQIDVSDESTFPTAAVIDGSGTVWVSSWPDQWVLGLEPETSETNRIDLEHLSRGLAVDGNGGLLVSGSEQQRLSKIVTEEDRVEWTVFAGYLSNGVATSENGQIWVASAGDSALARYTADGQSLGSLTLSGGPTGVAVDQDGKIWVLGEVTDTVYRVDPISANTDLQKTLVGTTSHNATGDLAGIVAWNLTSHFGTWTVIYDSQVAGTPWGVISWQAVQPAGTSVAVRARSSQDEENWSSWEPAASGIELSLTPAGRYIEIQVSLQWVSGDDLPTLEELTVAPTTIVVVPAASFTWSPDLPVVGQLISFADTSSGDPSSWSWDFGDGSASTLQNPTHSFTSQGDFEVSLEASNDSGSDTAAETIAVGPGSGCTLTCTATAPQTAELSMAVAFGAEVVASGCSATADYSWSFGDGATSDEQNPSHTYNSIGTLRWSLTATADDAICSQSGDITVSGAGPDECTLTYWVPVVSRTNGANGSVWQSDLGLLGVDPAGAAVELTFHGSDPNPTQSVTVVPGAMVNLVDVVNWIDPGFSGSGALEICADGDLVVTSRTYNTIVSDEVCFPSGTFGQYLGGEPDDAGLTIDEIAWLGQLRESAEFRTNIGLTNTGSEPATVEITLFDATGAELASFEVGLDAGQWRQENQPFWQLAGLQDLDAGSARVSVVSGGPVVAYASVIDNQTNDATTIPMRK